MLLKKSHRADDEKAHCAASVHDHENDDDDRDGDGPLKIPKKE